MIIKVIGSSSEGNCYLLINGDSTLIIECGCKMSLIKKALNYNLKNVVGCIVTHEHKDHASSVAEMMKCGIKVYGLPTVFKRLRNKALAVDMRPKELHHIGDYDIRTLRVNHDVPCLAFIIDHKDMGRLLFATDNFAFGYNVPDVKHLMIECNYSDDILENNIQKNPELAYMRKRLLTSHMELKETKKVVKHYADGLSDVILIHLSDGNSDAQRFADEVRGVAGVPVYVADAGKEFELF